MNLPHRSTRGATAAAASAARGAAPLASAADALAAQGLVVQRGDREVLRGVSFALRRGEWTALVGANGQGKSTLLATLAGLLPADAGHVALDGQPLAVWPRDARARRLGWLSQQGEAEGELAAIDLVRLGRLPHHGWWGAPGAEDEAAVARAMADTDCAALAARRFSALSGGERQRVLLARLLAGDTGVLLLDEPATHLDAPHQRALLRVLATRAGQGAAVLVALHDLTQALAADRVLLLRDGAIAADGAPGEATLHAALEAAFDGAFAIVEVAYEGLRRWVAIPR